MSLRDFSDRTVVILGGTSGIGRASALAFAAAGARVVIAGLGPAEGRSLEAELAHAGAPAALFIETDVRREEQVQAVMEQAQARFGRIHAAVNNAGTEGRFGPVEEATAADFEHVIGTNLKGVWHGLKHQIRHMRAYGAGAIVNTASTAGVSGIANIALYTASKHGIIGLTRATALELAGVGIRVNAIAPGPVDTGLLHRMVDGHVPLAAIAASVPMGRIAQPAEIAGAILWLCSDSASYVTGHVLVIDGGLTAA